VLFVDGKVPEHPERRFPVLFSFKLFPADHTFMANHPSASTSSRDISTQSLFPYPKRGPAQVKKIAVRRTHGTDALLAAHALAWR